ncbi:MAG: efflux RND transporter periplasmic adaptor subunit, partial [Duncaniella sp.]|nr:efflux RND transporter periplasmic adaptor subunit [Duncaniella sp.]
MTRYFIPGALALLMPCLTGCGSHDDNTLRDQIPAVYTFCPEGNMDTTVSNYTSTVEEGRSISAGFKTGGQIKRLTVDKGAYVSKGQVLGYLDDADYRLGVEQLETQYAQVSNEIRRIEEMHRHNNVSDNDYEKATAGLAQLKTQLEMARNKLDYTRLVAPASGYIVERYMEEGEMAGAGTPVFKIVDNSSVETTVAMSPAAYSRRGDILKCTGRSTVTGDTEFPLDVIGFIPDGDNNSLFRLRLRIPDAYRDRLLPGMNMSVKIHYGSGADAAALRRIPSRALFEREGKTFVWVVGKDSVLTAHEVSVTGAPDGKYSLAGGLEDGDVIVAAGVNHLTDGSKVNIIGDIDNLMNGSDLCHA